MRYPAIPSVVKPKRDARRWVSASLPKPGYQIEHIPQHS